MSGTLPAGPPRAPEPPVAHRPEAPAPSCHSCLRGEVVPTCRGTGAPARPEPRRSRGSPQNRRGCILQSWGQPGSGRHSRSGRGRRGLAPPASGRRTVTVTPGRAGCPVVTALAFPAHSCSPKDKQEGVWSEFAPWGRHSPPRELATAPQLPAHAGSHCRPGLWPGTYEVSRLTRDTSWNLEPPGPRVPRPPGAGCGSVGSGGSGRPPSPRHPSWHLGMGGGQQPWPSSSAGPADGWEHSQVSAPITPM